MKSCNLFFSFLISLTFTIPVTVFAEDQANADGKKSVQEIVNDVLLLYGNGGSGGGVPDGSGGGTITTGGSGGGGGVITTGGGGAGSGGPSTHPNIINVVSPEGQAFSLTKLNSQGQEVPATSSDWSCLKDNINNLIWEVKTGDGLHDQVDTFSWYDPAQIASTKGFANNSGASCEGYVAGDESTWCNTDAYKMRVNVQGLCGYSSDWDLPSLPELQSIVKLKTAAPELFGSIFPQGTDKAVWTASPYAGYPGFAWHLYLNDGYSHGNDKSGNLPVILVRNAQP